MLALAEHPAAYSEQALSVLWSRAHTLADALITETGERLRVIYPGRPGASAGPDFRDAVLLADDGSAVTGDIELHTSAPGWYRHGHDSDPNYNGVALHVVFSPKGHTEARMRSGMSAPVLALEAVAEPLDAAQSETSPPLLALDCLRASQEIASALDAAGDARFLSKSQGFAMDIAHLGRDDAIYLGIMDALGYATNRKPFRALAQRVPFSALAMLRDEPPATRLVAIKAMLLGASGIMSLVDESESPGELRRIRRRLPKARPLNKRDWRLFRVRPSNHPCRRIIGAAHLIDACVERGIVGTLAQALLDGGMKELRSSLQHAPYIGRPRALDILVNVVLPFLHADAGLRGEGELQSSALCAYASAPKLQDNEITREMRRLLNIGSEVKMTARRQQGMIQLYRKLVRGSPISQLAQSTPVHTEA